LFPQYRLIPKQWQHIPGFSLGLRETPLPSPTVLSNIVIWKTSTQQTLTLHKQSALSRTLSNITHATVVNLFKAQIKNFVACAVVLTYVVLS